MNRSATQMAICPSGSQSPSTWALQVSWPDGHLRSHGHLGRDHGHLAMSGAQRWRLGAKGPGNRGDVHWEGLIDNLYLCFTPTKTQMDRWPSPLQCGRPAPRKDSLMKAHDAVIAWTPVARTDRPDAGQVAVRDIAMQQPGWLRDRSSAIGAISADWKKLRGHELTKMVFVEFVTLTVRDGLDPQAVHEAFLAIDEYAESISPDTPGARFADDE